MSTLAYVKPDQAMAPSKAAPATWPDLRLQADIYTGLVFIMFFFCLTLLLMAVRMR